MVIIGAALGLMIGTVYPMLVKLFIRMMVALLAMIGKQFFMMTKTILGVMLKAMRAAFWIKFVIAAVEFAKRFWTAYLSFGVVLVKVGTK